MRTTEGPAGRTVLDRLAAVSSLDTDTHEVALRKRILVLAATTITALSVVRVVTYWILGLHLAAAIPFAYQLVSIVNLIILAKTGCYRFFRACELGLSLILPFLLQLSLGGKHGATRRSLRVAETAYMPSLGSAKRIPKSVPRGTFLPC
jgi:hypothetical protein